MPEEFLAQPFLRNFGANIEDSIDALEVAAECKIEAIEVLLVLDETQPRQCVKIIERQRHDASLERFDQRQELSRRDWQLERFEVQEEFDQHRIYAVR